GGADEDDRDAHDDQLARDQFLEVDVEKLALERMPLNFTDQRPRSLPADRELDHRVLGRDMLEQLLEIARIDRERLGLSRMPVNDAGNLSRRPELSRDALSRTRTLRRRQLCCRHLTKSPRAFGASSPYSVPQPSVNQTTSSPTDRNACIE